MVQVLTALVGIFRDNLLPVFCLMGLGYLVQVRLGLDMRTLVRLNLWIFVPALVIDRLSHARLPAGDLWRVVGFTLAVQAASFLACRGWARARHYSVGLAGAFTCAVIFYNSGNFGLPVMELVFGKGSPAVALQTIVLVVQNTTTFGLGQLIIRGPHIGWRRALVEYLKMPFLYAIALGLVLQRTGWQLPAPLARPIATAGDGLIPVALVTLGAQLGSITWHGSKRPVAAATLLRLVGGPLIAFCLLKLLGWHGLLAQQLLISAAVPSAINAALLAIEFDSEPDFAAQTVFVTTLLCALTVAVTILCARTFFPLGG
jgi:predicted permease